MAFILIEEKEDELAKANSMLLELIVIEEKANEMDQLKSRQNRCNVM